MPGVLQPHLTPLYRRAGSYPPSHSPITHPQSEQNKLVMAGALAEPVDGALFVFRCAGEALDRVHACALASCIKPAAGCAFLVAACCCSVKAAAVAACFRSVIVKWLLFVLPALAAAGTQARRRLRRL